MHQRVLLSIFVFTVCLPRLYAEGSKVYRGDSSQLPKVDMTKKFGAKSFEGADKQIEVRELELGVVKLPYFSGNLETLPTPGWKTFKSDLYPQAIELRDFEVKGAAEELSRPAPESDKTVSIFDDSNLASRRANTEKEEIKPSAVSPMVEAEDEELRLLINLGVEPADVRFGHGFGAKALKPSASTVGNSKGKAASPPTKISQGISIEFP